MSKPLRILYVDDDSDDRDLFSSAVADIDPSVEVIEISSGSSALAYLYEAKLSNKLPDLVLIDINLPALSGRQILTLIQDDPHLHNLCIAMFSTSVSPQDENHFRSKNVMVYKKPSTFPLFRKQIEDFLAMCKENKLQ